jgi:hypothetical protein
VSPETAKAFEAARAAKRAGFGVKAGGSERPPASSLVERAAALLDHVARELPDDLAVLCRNRAEELRGEAERKVPGDLRARAALAARSGTAEEPL